MDTILNHPQFSDIATALELDRGLPIGSLKAVALQESGGHADANAGKAYGLMQFTPETAKQYNVDVKNPWDSLRGAADYLSDLQHQYGSFDAALAGYNGGTSQAKLVANGQQPTYGETKNYVAQVNDRMQKTTPSNDTVVSAIENQVANMKLNGANDALVVQSLLKSPIADVVNQARQQWFSDSDIVSRIGGQPLQAAVKAQQGVDAENPLVTAGHTIADTTGDLVNGAQQLGARVTGNDAELQALQVAQQQAQADPTRQARENTTTGTVTSGVLKAAPYLAATAVAPEGVIANAALDAGIGASQGALTPTTADGQFASNVGEGALLGAAGGAGGRLLGNAISGAAGGLGGDAAATARLAAAQDQGLPVSVGAVNGPNGFWRNVMERMPNSSAVQGAQSSADAAIAKKVAGALGLQDYAGPIDTDMLNAARPGIKQALDDATNVQVVLPQSLKTDLEAIGQQYSNPLTSGIAQTGKVQQAVSNLSEAADSGAAVSGRDLQGLASELKDVLYNQTASHQEKELASAVIDKINGTLTDAMSPEQRAAFQTANDQYKHLLAVQKQVSLSNDSGVVSPRQMLQAAKTGSFKNAFLKGNAPFQDLATTAADLYGPANGRGLGSVIGKQLGGDDHGLMAAAVLEPQSGVAALLAKKAAGALLGKIAASDNPVLIRALTGAGRGQLSPVMQSYIARALGGGGAALGASSQ